MKRSLGANHLLRSGQQAFALQALAGQLTGAADGLGLVARALFRRLFVVHVPLHLAERAFALHLLLQGLQRLVDIIVADENLTDDLVLRERRRRLISAPGEQKFKRREKLSRRLRQPIPEQSFLVHAETTDRKAYKLIS